MEEANNTYHYILGNSEDNLEKLLPIIKYFCKVLGIISIHKIIAFMCMNNIQLKDIIKEETPEQQ